MKAPFTFQLPRSVDVADFSEGQMINLGWWLWSCEQIVHRHMRRNRLYDARWYPNRK